MPSGATMNAKLGIEPGDRVYLRNARAKTRSILKWDMPAQCELLEGDLPYPPVHVALTWVTDEVDLDAHLGELADRIPDDGHLFVVIASPRERGGDRSRTREEVLEAAGAHGFQEGEVVHLEDGDMAVGLVPE